MMVLEAIVTSESIEIELASAEDGGRWNDFVMRHPEGSVALLFQWKEIFETVYGKPCYFVWARDSERVVGVAPLVHMRGILGGNRLVSLPFLDQGGLLADSDEVAGQLWAYCRTLAARLGAGGIDLHGTIPTPIETPAETERYRWLLDLGGNEDELWLAIGPKVRNQIRKSEREGLVSGLADSSRLPEFYQVFSDNMLALGSPSHSVSLFSQIFAGFDSRARLFLTSTRAGKVVAGAVALRFGSLVTVPWASSDAGVRSACPNHSLYWAIFRQAVEEGVSVFDFGRSTVGTGTFRFKKQWRGVPVPLHWASYDLAGRLQERAVLSAQRNPVLARLWSRLPAGLARRLGPWIRGHIAN